jgi:adenine-specific DNA-methyltransferase
MDERPNLRFPITWENEEIWPDKQWQWSQERVDFALRNNELIISKQSGKWSVRYKQYLYDENGEERSSKLFSVLEGPFTQIGTQEIKDLLGEGKILAFPKPSDLIKQFIATTWKEKNSIILDFFAGSATTAHAVLDLNKEDGGNRKFIMVQLPEECDEKSEAFRAGYKTIAEIGKERIRRVIEKIKEEKEGKLDFGEDKQDLGFKVFKLRESNFKNWRSKIKTEEELVGQLQGHIEPLDENAATEDVLYELLLKSGISLTAKIEGKENYFLIDGSGLVLILEKVNEEVIKRVIAERPGKVITLDRLFKGNDQLKTNTALQMKDAGIDFRAV